MLRMSATLLNEYGMVWWYSIFAGNTIHIMLTHDRAGNSSHFVGDFHSPLREVTCAMIMIIMTASDVIVTVYSKRRLPGGTCSTSPEQCTCLERSSTVSSVRDSDSRGLPRLTHLPHPPLRLSAQVPK